MSFRYLLITREKLFQSVKHIDILRTFVSVLILSKAMQERGTSRIKQMDQFVTFLIQSLFRCRHVPCKEWKPQAITRHSIKLIKAFLCEHELIRMIDPIMVSKFHLRFEADPSSYSLPDQNKKNNLRSRKRCMMRTFCCASAQFVSVNPPREACCH